MKLECGMKEIEAKLFSGCSECGKQLVKPEHRKLGKYAILIGDHWIVRDKTDEYHVLCNSCAEAMNTSHAKEANELILA